MGMPSARFPDLDGVGIVVTGGASGIGASLVAGFAAQGARVAFLDVNRDAGHALAETLAPKHGFAPLFLPVDLRDIAAAQAAINQAAAHLGGLKVLINNAAWDDRHDLDLVTEAYWDNNIAVNLKPVFFTCQAAAPHMRKGGGGSIINFSSIAWMMNLPDMPAYVTAKAGIIGLTKGLAGKLGPDNIRVNAVLPGMVLTERQKQLWITDEAAEEQRNRQALRFSLEGDDLVGPCLFLASDCARAITAQSIIVDGGYV